MEKYKKIGERYIEELKSQFKVYRHIKSGARIVTIENEDENKVFTIGFRTPAINSYGLTHILEHSVLNGSKKYPVKDPFAYLVKSSLNTFLNAMTYPDKTVYPVASQNMQDLKNLMSVYLDAVFFPQVLTNEKIFRQEGWRYELFSKDEPLIYNGVVYNEMKGAFSNPEDIMQRNIFHDLFPSNCYQYESGGDPEVIPNLSYEDFCNFHKKYYVPSNSYIYLYGKMDMEERMEFIDREYLSKFDKVDFDTTVKYQEPFKEIKEVSYKYPIDENEDEEDNVSLAFAFAIDSYKKIDTCFAVDILNNILFNSPGAPVKKKLLEEGICKAVSASFDDDIIQPINNVVLNNVDLSKKDKFLDVYYQTLREITDKGLDKQLIKSRLKHLEFVNKEERISPDFPKGLEIILTSLGNYIYDEEDWSLGLEDVKMVKNLQAKVDEGFFEKVLKEEFIDNKHAVLLTMIPSKTLQEEKEEKLKLKLEDIKSKLSSEEIDDLISKSIELRKYQEEQPTQEQLDTLPKLKKEDLYFDLKDFDSEKTSLNGFDLYKQILPTNGIAYVTYRFTIDSLDNSLYPYVSLLGGCLGKFRTENYSQIELRNEILTYLGNITFSPSVLTTVEGKTMIFGEVRFSCLYENMEKAHELVEEILFRTKFDDYDYLKNILFQRKNNLESSIAYNGNVFSRNLVLSQQYLEYYIKDLFNGISFFDFISELCDTFDTNKKAIVDKLVEVTHIVYSKFRLHYAYTGEKEGYSTFEKCASVFTSKLQSKTYSGKLNFVPCKKNVAIKAPYDICFVSVGGQLLENSSDYKGCLAVLNNAVNMDYLYSEVRVKNGAYGVGMNTNFNKLYSISSYRDPNLDKTVNAYKGIGKFLEGISYSEQELLNCKIGAIAGFNPVIHVSTQGEMAYYLKLVNRTNQERKQYVKELIETDNSDIKYYASIFTKAINDAPIVVIGNSKLIEKSKIKFDEIRNLSK